MILNNNIIKRLEDVIAETGYKPTPLMLELGLSRGAFYHLAKAKNINKSYVLRKICEKLNINRDYVLTGDGSKFINPNMDEKNNFEVSSYISKLEGKIELLKEQLAERDKVIADQQTQINRLKELINKPHKVPK